MSSDGVAVAVIFILGIAAFIFWVWALVDVVRMPDDSMFKAGNKLVWVLVIAITGVIGAIIYLVVGRPAPGSRPSGMPPSVDRIDRHPSSRRGGLTPRVRSLLQLSRSSVLRGGGDLLRGFV